VKSYRSSMRTAAWSRPYTTFSLYSSAIKQTKVNRRNTGHQLYDRNATCARSRVKPGTSAFWVFLQTKRL